MSYIPDYRADSNKLTRDDKHYWMGYQNAMEDARNNLQSAMENCDIVSDDLEAEFDMLCDCSEVETMCSVVENNDAYEDVEFKDSNRPMYTGTRGAKK